MGKNTKKAGQRIKNLRALFVDAKEKIDQDAYKRQYEPAEKPRKLGDEMCYPGFWPGAPDEKMPENCPFKVVGRDTEGTIYIITTTGHLRAVDYTKLTDNVIADLAAPATNEVLFAWPSWSKERRIKLEDGTEQIKPAAIVRMETKSCARAIINEAARLPDFDPLKQHRGRGGWQDKDGNFIWHSGKWLWRRVNNRLEKATPEAYADYLYTRQQPIAAPWQEAVEEDEDDSPALLLYKELATWSWTRPKIDPLLVLGWICTAIMGGALDARPILFTTGGAGVGKSTLHALIKTVFNGCALSTVDASAAGIYQQIKQDSLPVIVDELESRANSTKSQSVVELARLAFTGGMIYRGGQDNTGISFNLQCSFFFSAINPPAMGAQDRSRMAILNLERLDKHHVGRERLSKERQAIIGRQLLRQVMDTWPRFCSEILPDIREILKAKDFDARAIDTFGTLLGAARLVLGDTAFEDLGFPVTDANEMGKLVAELTEVEREEKVDNWHACLSHLLQSAPDYWQSGEKPSVGLLLERFSTGTITLQLLRERLATANLGFKQLNYEEYNANCLAVPRDGPNLKKIFAGEIWQNGVWWTALRQAPSKIVITGLRNQQKVSINGETKHCLLVDMTAFYSWLKEEQK